MHIYDGSSSKKELGFDANKKVPITRLLAIHIKKFRSFKDQIVNLGDHLTVFSGRNGTMKTSIMGLIAHPFDSDAEDAFGKTLKTTLKDVFNLSSQYDAEQYEYDLIIETGDDILREPVFIYYVADKTQRHRVVVSGAEKGDGNFLYNTSFLNLKRLFPLVDTTAQPDLTQALSADEFRDLKRFFETVLPSSTYGTFAPIHQKNVKTTFAPHGADATYDWNSISSGEDNLGSIFNRLLGFQRTLKKGQTSGNGILCIDEFDSSLHPVAQIRLFEFLYRWSQKYKVQIILSTHSLHLIQHIYLKHQANLDADRININFISKSQSILGNHPILKNPPYELAYKELTLEAPADVAEARKVKVFCEDDFAVHFAKRLIGSQTVLRLVEFHSSLDPASGKPGTSYTALKSLCVQFPLLMSGSLVLFDGDVGEDITSKIKNKNMFLTLPDPDGFALERRIVHYIISLENGHHFFVKFKERDAFLDSFAAEGISLSLADVADEAIVPIDMCKRWAGRDRTKFRQYVTYYCSTLNKIAFQKDFLDKVNKVNSSLGLPLVSS